jgi:uncharacterized protein (TIGR03086 family)
MNTARMNIAILHTLTEDFASYLPAVTDEDLKRPTPCIGWSVGDLYEHVIEENAKFGHAVCGLPVPQGATTETPSSRSADGWLTGIYRESARYVEQAFAEAEDPERRHEVAGVPGARRVADLFEMQIVDTLIHTWDLTQGIGVDYEPRPEIAELVLRRMQEVPDAARGEGKPFREILVVADVEQLSTLDRLLLLSGRDLDWRSGLDGE